MKRNGFHHATTSLSFYSPFDCSLPPLSSSSVECYYLLGMTEWWMRVESIHAPMLHEGADSQSRMPWRMTCMVWSVTEVDSTRCDGEVEWSEVRPILTRSAENKHAGADEQGEDGGTTRDRGGGDLVYFVCVGVQPVSCVCCFLLLLLLELELQPFSSVDSTPIAHRASKETNKDGGRKPTKTYLA